MKNEGKTIHLLPIIAGGQLVGSFNRFFCGLSVVRRLVFGLFFCALVLVGNASPSYAVDKDSSANSKTEIMVDDETDTVTILINGEPVVLIDAQGLHVKGNIEYGGTIADVGRDNAIPVTGDNGNEDE